MLQVEGVSPELVESISPEIETFISSIKSGTIGGYKGTSLSTAAAQATVRLMGKIIERFQEFENEGGDAGSPTMHMRQKGLSEVEVVSNQVQRLLMLVARTSAALIRPQFGTLLLTNVTRRVLSIIRDTAAETRASAEEIEKMCSRLPGAVDPQGTPFPTFPQGGSCSVQPSEDPLRRSTSMDMGLSPQPHPEVTPSPPSAASSQHGSPPSPGLVGSTHQCPRPTRRSSVDSTLTARTPSKNNKANDRRPGSHHLSEPSPLGFESPQSNNCSTPLEDPHHLGLGTTMRYLAPSPSRGPGQHSRLNSWIHAQSSLTSMKSDEYERESSHSAQPHSANDMGKPCSSPSSSVAGALSSHTASPPKPFLAFPHHPLPSSTSPHDPAASSSPGQSNSSALATPSLTHPTGFHLPRMVRFSSTAAISGSIENNPMNMSITNTNLEIPGQHTLRRPPPSNDISFGSFADLRRTGTSRYPQASTGCLSAHCPWIPEFPVRLQEFYDSCLRGLEEFEQEVEAMTSELCKRVDRQIHRGDVLITIGCTHTVRQYLLAASRLQTFRVLLLDGAPTSSSAMVDQLAAELAERHVDVQRLPDSSAFAVMNTCTKVVIGAESVLANGGMLGQIGTRMLCVAARHFAVPVLVATTTLKMSPYYPSDQLCSRLVRITKARAQELPWSIYGAPELVLPMPQGVWVKCDAAVSRPADSAPHRGIMGSRSPAAYSTSQSSSLVTTPTMAVGVPLMGPVNTSHSRYHTAPVESIELSEVSVHCASTEYVPPEYVTLYATNDSELAPSQCHRIIRANYNDAD